MHRGGSVLHSACDESTETNCVSPRSFHESQEKDKGKKRDSKESRSCAGRQLCRNITGRGFNYLYCINIHLKSNIHPLNNKLL